MARFNTIDDLKAYVLRTLGDGAIDQELTDAHIYDAIEDALDYWFQNSGDGAFSYKTAVFYANGNPDVQLPYEVNTVLKVMSSISQMPFFTQAYYQESMYFLHENVGSTRFDMTSYYLFNQYIDTMNMVFNKNYAYTYNSTTKILTLTPNPHNTNVAVHYSYANDRYSPEMLSHNWIYRYAVAKARERWGGILSVYSGATIVGNITVDGQAMLSKAENDLTNLIAEFDAKWSDPPEMFLG